MGSMSIYRFCSFLTQTLLLGEMILISFGFVLTQLGVGVASGRHFEIGTVYTYDYVVGVELNEPLPLVNYSSSWDSSKASGYRTGSTVGYKVFSQVQVTPVWQSEGDGAVLEIMLIKPQLQIKSRKAPSPEGFHDHSSFLDSAVLHPIYIHWKEGTVHKTFTVESDDISLVNLKKGIASLLQFQTRDTITTEETPRGQCTVTYTNRDSSHLTKTLSECLLPSDETIKEKYTSTSHSSAALRSTTQSSVKVDMKLTADSFVEEASAVENHVVRVNAKKEVGARIDGTQHLKLSGSSTANTQMVKAVNVDTAISEIGKVKELKLKLDSLIPHPEKIPLCEVTNCKPIDALLSTLTGENMASSKLASAFIQLVDKFRRSSPAEIKKILNDVGPRTLPQILDVCAATGTKNAHKAVMKTLNFNDPEEITNPERYLLGLGLTTTPDPEIVTGLFSLIKKGLKNSKLQESLILTTAAMVHTVRNQGSQNFGAEIEAFLLESIDKCSAEKPECYEIYLRAFKNLRSSSTVPKLLEIVQKSESRVGVVAMKALHAMPNSYFNQTHRPLLIRIINQLGKKYDSSTRTLAIDILLRDNPTKAEIRDILSLQLKSSNPLHAEVGTFLWNRLHEFMNTNPAIETYVKEIIEEEGLHTYHHLSPKGLSTSFSRTFASNPSGNSTFSNAIEMTGKILKRSSFDVYLHSENSFVHPLSLGIFAGGLSSFTSSDDGENAPVEDDTEEPTAGMELSLMGVQTRPIVFFVGKGELMGLVWSGAGAEKTTALQGNVLLQNEQAMVPLSNGLVADINIQGGISFDLSGQMTISLWHRTANSLVQSKAGIVLQSVIRVDTSFVRSRVDYTVASEATLDFTSDINFYDGVLMCLKLTQPEFNIKQNIHKTERIPGSKHRLRKARYNTIPVPGLTYALNKKNSQLCGIMYKDEL